NKLNINNNELLVKHLQEPSLKNIIHAENGIIPVFAKWSTVADNLGSSINFTTTNEKINGQYHLCYNISGVFNTDSNSYAGVYTHPDPSTLELMKKMTSFSFKVLGDGNFYLVLIPTLETTKAGNNNHYHKIFETKKDKVSEIHVKISDLVQFDYYGKKVKFNLNNIVAFQFNAYSTGNINLKIWDIKFYL
ncbi:MAG: CIA30 family protein, partial [Treponema sp.]|nr:CIA30 family protein [Treponema sp.]